MAVHRVDEFEFEFWRGQVPTLLSPVLQQFSRAGADGVSHRNIATRGRRFECELVSWHATRADARDKLLQYVELIGADPVQIVKDEEDLEQSQAVRFVVEDVQELECVANVRLLGPGKNYPSGVSLVTRWAMTPVEVSD